MLSFTLLLLAASPNAGDQVAPQTPSALTLPSADPSTDGLEATLASEYAGGASDALQICCMATWCTTALIDDCDLLSPVGKGVAAGMALTGGLVGFGLGYATAVVLTSGDDKILLLPIGETIGSDAEGYAAMGLLTGAAGVFVGGAVGVVGALLVEPWVRFFFAAPTPRVTPPPAAVPQPQRSPEPTAPGSAPPRP